MRVVCLFVCSLVSVPLACLLTQRPGVWLCRRPLYLVEREEAEFKQTLGSDVWHRVKVKGTLEQTTKAQKYSSTLSLILALDGVSGQRHVPAALPSGKARYPLYMRLGGI